MIALEKVLILKTVALFKYTPEEILLTVADAVKEELVDAGQVIIQKGDLGDVMYIIAEGSVKVHDGDRLLAKLDKRDVFGELAALVPEKRIASVTAEENCLLLTMDSELLYDLMDMYSDLSRGIIQFLCQRVRTISATA
jgi:CRP/FNR family cyclic AMP-dependent transcriptional regulator